MPRRRFRAWWLRDLGRSSLPLLGVTALAAGVDSLLWISALNVLPELNSLLSTRSFTQLFHAGIGLLGHPGALVTFVVLFVLTNLLFADWAILVLIRRSLNARLVEQRPSRAVRFFKLLTTSGTALVILLAIFLIGSGLAYGVSRWYFGAVLPIILVTLLVLILFTSWFLFVPFVVLRDGLTGARALSESRRRARRISLRLVTLLVLLALALAAVVFELDGLSNPVRAGLVLLFIPFSLSCLATLYAETDPSDEPSI